MKPITRKKITYTLFVYSSFESEKPDHTFTAEGNRAVVGIMKTIMDNFKVSHIDIMNDQDFYNINKNQTQF